MKNKNLWIGIGIVVIIFIIAISVYYKFQNNTDDKIIRIGVILSLTGSQSQYSIEAKNALQLAQKRINDNSKDNCKIELFIEDSHDNTKDAFFAFNKIMLKDPICIIDAGSVVGMSLAPQGEKIKKPLLTLLASDEPIPLVNDWCFRAHLCAKDEAILMARYAMSTLNCKRIGILSINNSHGLVSSDFFTKEVTKLGGEIVKTATYEIGDVDVREQIMKILNEKPEAIYIFGYGIGYISCFNQLKEAGFKGLMLTMDAFASESDRKATEASNEGVYFTNSLFERNFNDSSKTFYDEYAKTYNSNPSHMGAIAYETLRIIANVINEGAQTSAQLRDGLLNYKEKDSSIGDLSFSSNRGLLVPLTVWQIKNGVPVKKDAN